MWRLIDGRLEMVVALPAASATRYYEGFAVGGYFAEQPSAIGVFHDGAQGYFNDTVGSVGSGFECAPSGSAVFRKDMTLIFKVY
jgi:hypothetical protein